MFRLGHRAQPAKPMRRKLLLLWRLFGWSRVFRRVKLGGGNVYRSKHKMTTKSGLTSRKSLAKVDLTKEPSRSWSLESRLGRFAAQ
jgi:hypothetical protein